MASALIVDGNFRRYSMRGWSSPASSSSNNKGLLACSRLTEAIPPCTVRVVRSTYVHWEANPHSLRVGSQSGFVPTSRGRLTLHCTPDGCDPYHHHDRALWFVSKSRPAYHVEASISSE